MSNAKYNLAVRLLVEQFKRAAVVTHFGDEDEDHAMQLAGIRGAKRAAQGLDAFDARLALLPLLEDPDWGVRAFAGGYLLRVAPEPSAASFERRLPAWFVPRAFDSSRVAQEIRTRGIAGIAPTGLE